MKEKELRDCADCNLCGNKIGASQMPFFWRVRLERHGLDIKALSRQQGLAMSMGGNAELAMIMGPDEEFTMPLMEPITITVCETCSMEPINCLAALAETKGGA